MYYMTNRLSYFLDMQVLLEGDIYRIWEGLHFGWRISGSMYASK